MSNITDLKKEGKLKSFFRNNFLRFGFSVFFVVLLVGFVMLRLAWWQWNRYNERLEVKMHYAIASQQAPVPLLTLPDFNDSRIGESVTIKGRFLPDQYFLHEGQFVDNQYGFDVLMPFKVENTDKIVLVNRGWVNSDREDIVTPDSTVELQGRIRIPFALTFGFHEEVKPGWPKKIAFTDLEKLQEYLKAELVPVLVMLDNDNPYALQAHWKPTAIHPERNLGYFFQWLAFAMVWFGGFVVLNRRS